jgi:hypothetical protein
MQRNPEFILRDEKTFNKFCVKEDKVFGCKSMFGCTIACPLYRAKMVEYLINEKGMTIGEAHKACLRNELSKEGIKECLKSIFKFGEKTISMDMLIEILEKNENKSNRKTDE